MSLVRDAVAVIRELESVKEPLEILTGVTRFTKTFGFEHVTMLRKAPDVDSVEDSVLITAAPKAFIADYDMRGYSHFNPLLKQAERSAMPFTAHEISHRHLSEPEHEVLSFIKDKLDLTDGYIVPMRCATHGDGTVLFGGNAPKQDPLKQSVLNMLGHCVYGHINDLIASLKIKPVDSERAQPLTARERECLQWVARGKTDFEIGIILGISARTARFHIENSKRKLGVASRVQAVTSALRGGVIAN